MHNHQNGVNLLDLLVVLALLALLMGVAFPGYQALQEKQRQAAELNRLQAILQLTRTLATLHQQELTLCLTQNAQNCSSSQLGADLLLVNQALQPLRHFPGHETQIAFPDHDITLQPLPHRSSGGTLLPCSGFTQQPARAITFSVTGRPRINNDPPSSLVNRCPP
jgi:type IV fimbrial biogenesis protein FimT